MIYTSPESACRTTRQFRARHAEASLNWLALGLLLAAWNACNDDPPPGPQDDAPAVKGHKSVNEL